MSKKTKCKPGEILKEAFTRKDHVRKKYKRSDGTIVKGSKVKGSYVEATCIKDKGQPGKGLKTLPKLSGKLHLSKSYGYNLHKSDKSRHESLREAMKKNNPLEVYRHLVLIHNYTADSQNKDILRNDVEYMKKLYRKYKSKKQSGGTKKEDSTQTVYKRYVYEKHVINNKSFVIKTVEPDRTTVSLDSVKKYLDDPDYEVFEVTIDAEPYGYFVLKFTDSVVTVTEFSVNSGARSAALSFIGSYARLNDYDKIEYGNETITE